MYGIIVGIFYVTRELNGVDWLDVICINWCLLLTRLMLEGTKFLKFMNTCSHAKLQDFLNFNVEKYEICNYIENWMNFKFNKIYNLD